jgi:hypothetical protein
MTPSEIKVTAALDANMMLHIEAERLIAAYVAPESNRPAIINELITSSTARRSARRSGLAQEALGETKRAPQERG